MRSFTRVGRATIGGQRVLAVGGAARVRQGTVSSRWRKVFFLDKMPKAFLSKIIQRQMSRQPPPPRPQGRVCRGIKRKSQT